MKITQPTLPKTFVYTTKVINPNSHVENWAKAGFMARMSLDDDSPYAAALSAADDDDHNCNYGTRLQARQKKGDQTTKTSLGRNPSSSGIPCPYAYAQRTTVSWDGANTHVKVEAGLGGHSQMDTVGFTVVSGWLGYHGLAASSHGKDKKNPDGSHIRFGFFAYNVTVDDETMLIPNLRVKPDWAETLPTILDINSGERASQWDGYLVRSNCEGFCK